MASALDDAKSVIDQYNQKVSEDSKKPAAKIKSWGRWTASTAKNWGYEGLSVENLGVDADIKAKTAERIKTALNGGVMIVTEDDVLAMSEGSFRNEVITGNDTLRPLLGAKAGQIVSFGNDGSCHIDPPLTPEQIEDWHKLLDDPIREDKLFKLYCAEIKASANPHQETRSDRVSEAIRTTEFLRDTSGNVANTHAANYPQNFFDEGAAKDGYQLTERATEFKGFPIADNASQQDRLEVVSVQWDATQRAIEPYLAAQKAVVRYASLFPENDELTELQTKSSKRASEIDTLQQNHTLPQRLVGASDEPVANLDDLGNRAHSALEALEPPQERSSMSMRH